MENAFFLVIGKKRKEPMVNERDEIRVEEVMDIAFSLDHRVTGGLNFSNAITLFTEFFENPGERMKQPENLPDPFIMA